MAASLLLPRVMPAAILQNGYLFSGTLIGGGVLAGVMLQRYGMPIAAVGVGIPLLAMGGVILYSNIMASAAGPSGGAAPKLNPDRRFADVHQRSGPMFAAADRASGSSMGAIASYTPRLGMGAVFGPSRSTMGAVYGATMGAVEALVGDRSARPIMYSRAGHELGAR